MHDFAKILNVKCAIVEHLKKKQRHQVAEFHTAANLTLLFQYIRFLPKFKSEINLNITHWTIAVCVILEVVIVFLV